MEEGGQDQDEEAVKVLSIADLPLRLVYGLRDGVPLIYQVWHIYVVTVSVLLGWQLKITTTQRRDS